MNALPRFTSSRARSPVLDLEPLERVSSDLPHQAFVSGTLNDEGAQIHEGVSLPGH
jgi:hypothetical protein